MTRPCDVCAGPPAREGYAPASLRPPRGGRPMVERLQAALGDRGFYHGPADGVFTEPTHDALVRFQREKGLVAQGELTRETARELGLPR